MPMDGVKEVVSRLKKPVTVAGGIASTEEVVTICTSGVDVQVGMALYTGKVDPVEAIIGSIKVRQQGFSADSVVQD